MKRRSVHELAVTSSSYGSAQLTWGQRHMWQAAQWFGEDFYLLNLKLSTTLMPARPLDKVLDAIATLAAEQDVLRTVVEDGPVVTQRVLAGSRQPVLLVETTVGELPDASISALLDEEALTPFDLGSGPPARFVVVSSADGVAAVGVVASHVLFDGTAVQLLLTRLLEILEGEPALPETWGPLQQAAYEVSPAGQRARARALSHWRKVLTSAPSSTFSGEPHASSGFTTWRMDSIALRYVIPLLAHRTKTTESTVILAAAALMLATVSSRDVVAMKIISSNRFTTRMQGLIASTSQDGLMLLDFRDSTVERSIEKSYRLATEAYHNAFVDPEALADVFRDVSAARNDAVEVAAFYNDARFGMSWADDAPDVSNNEDLTCEALRAQTVVQVLETVPKHDMQFFVMALHNPTACRLTLLTHTGHVPDGALVLRLLEETLCQALIRQVRIEEIRAAYTAGSSSLGDVLPEAGG